MAPVDDGPDDRRENPEIRARVGEALDTAATEAARRAARKTAKRAAGGYFALILFLLLGAGAWQWNTNQRLERSETRACERLQAQRERTNVSEARQYRLLSAVAKSPRASNVVKVTYRGLASTTLYDPPTDCEEAVRHPRGYRRPASIPYTALPASFAESVVIAAREKRPQPTP